MQPIPSAPVYVASPNAPKKQQLGFSPLPLDNSKNRPYLCDMMKAMASFGDSIDRYMTEIKRYPVLDRQTELEVARRYAANGDVRAAHQLVVSNLRFVVKIAHEYRNYGFKLLDLIQEGNMGLMVAVKKFDPEKGYRLISYAIWWIRSSIQSFIMRSWSLVRLGATRTQRKLFFRLRSERAQAQREQRDVTQDVSTHELAERLAVDEAAVIDMEMRLAARDFSLDKPLDDTSPQTHLDQLGANDVPTPEDDVAQAQTQERVQGVLQEMMSDFNDKERYILSKRLMSDSPQTLQEIGENFQVSRERIRQLESRVVRKLRLALTPVVNDSQLPQASSLSA